MNGSKRVWTGVGLVTAFLIVCMYVAGCGPFVHDGGERRILGADSVYSASSPVGSSARALVSDDEFHQLTIELQAMPGAGPSPTVIDAFRKFVEKYVNKADGIDIIVDPPLPSAPEQAYTLGDIQELERRNRKWYPRLDRVTVYFLFVNGWAAEDFPSPDASGKKKRRFRTLGHSHQNTSVVIYGKTLQVLSGKSGMPATDVLETLVMSHEFGHLLGLVNPASPVRSRLPAQPPGGSDTHHCPNPACLMHFSYTTMDQLKLIYAGQVPDLDDDCRADLARMSR